MPLEYPARDRRPSEVRVVTAADYVRAYYKWLDDVRTGTYKQPPCVKCVLIENVPQTSSSGVVHTPPHIRITTAELFLVFWEGEDLLRGSGTRQTTDATGRWIASDKVDIDLLVAAALLSLDSKGYRLTWDDGVLISTRKEFGLVGSGEVVTLMLWAQDGVV